MEKSDHTKPATTEDAEVPKTKQPYTPPALVRLGSVSELTQGGSGRGLENQNGRFTKEQH